MDAGQGCGGCTQKHTHTHTHTKHAHTHTHSHTRTHARTHTRTLARSHARTLARSHARTHAHTHARTLARSHARTLTHAPRSRVPAGLTCCKWQPAKDARSAETSSITVAEAGICARLTSLVRTMSTEAATGVRQRASETQHSQGADALSPCINPTLTASTFEKFQGSCLVSRDRPLHISLLAAACSLCALPCPASV